MHAQWSLYLDELQGRNEGARQTNERTNKVPIHLRIKDVDIYVSPFSIYANGYWSSVFSVCYFKTL